MEQCKLCKVEPVANAYDYCESCTREIEQTMYEAQVNLGIGYKEFLEAVSDWLDWSTR